MKNWIKQKLYGKYIEHIDGLEKRIDDYKISKATLERKVKERDDIIEKIERSTRREDMRLCDELRLNLEIIDNDCLEYVVAINPLSIFESPEIDSSPWHERRLVRLSTYMGWAVSSDSTGDLSSKLFNHALCVNIAKEIGERVRDEIMKSNGWRPKL